MTDAIPDADEALADLHEVTALSSKDRDLKIILSRLVDEGTPLLQIDRVTAGPAGDFVVRYKIADEVKARLLALRASNPTPSPTP